MRMTMPHVKLHTMSDTMLRIAARSARVKERSEYWCAPAANSLTISRVCRQLVLN